MFLKICNRVDFIIAEIIEVQREKENNSKHIRDHPPGENIKTRMHILFIKEVKEKVEEDRIEIKAVHSRCLVVNYIYYFFNILVF